MPPCMAELVNTKLSLRMILPWGRKASQIPYLFLFAWREEAFWFLPVWENRQKSRKFLKALKWCSGFWLQTWLSNTQQPCLLQLHEVLSFGVRKTWLKFWCCRSLVWCCHRLPRVSRTRNRLLVHPTLLPQPPPAVWAQQCVTRIVSLPHFTDPGAWHGQHGVTNGDHAWQWIIRYSVCFKIDFLTYYTNTHLWKMIT